MIGAGDSRLMPRARQAAARVCSEGGVGVTSAKLILAGKCDHCSEVQSALAALLDAHTLACLLADSENDPECPASIALLNFADTLAQPGTDKLGAGE